jgi:CysZ protein
MITNNPTPNGVTYLLRGFKLIFKSGLRRYLIIPLIINIILFSAFVLFGYHLIGYFSSLLPHWLQWLKWIFEILFFVTSSVIIVYTFTIIANLIGCPFNSFLSEKVELITTGHKPSEGDTLTDTLKDIPRVLKREWYKIKYFLPRAALLLIFYFIPVINVIASVLWFVFSCWMMAMEYIDYPMDNHKTTFIDMKKHLHKNCFGSLSFGFGVLMASLIPVVNFVVMPAAVAGATLMYLEQKHQGEL